MYEYKFIEVPIERNLKSKRGDSFNKCKEIIIEEGKKGWEFKQVVIPANEKTGVASPYCYQIIFQKKVNED